MATGSTTPAPAATESSAVSLKDVSEVQVSPPGSSGEAAVSPVSPTVLSPSHPVFHTGDGKIFLDICSGATRPLSKAILAQHGDVLAFDILLDSRMDLLNDQSYEQLLRICSSGQVAYGAASPSCAHYSRLKLHRPGPKALRTPEAMQGVPGLTSAELLQVQDSYMMLFRCVTCLTLIYQAGGHAHLEQPPSAMSWLEDCVKAFVTLISAWCVVISACAYGKNWYKQWMFASSWQKIAELGRLCDHPKGSHVSLVGTVSDTGEYLSRQTACYPEDLATAFAERVAPLVSHSSHDWKWDDISQIPPLKTILQPPFGQEDGGGFTSNPDWSLGERVATDFFGPLRQKWVQRILDNRLDKFLVQFFSQTDHSSPPFAENIITPFRNDLEQFLQDSGINPDWTIRDHQPMCLHIMHGLCQIMQDPDQALFPALIEGVGTGFQRDIPLSNCFPLNVSAEADEPPLSAHLTNWQSADDDIMLTRQLVQQEIDKGWVFPFEGTLQDAQQRYPLGVALGKLGIAHADGRPPRLVLDQTICGLNGRCVIPERSTLPSAKDVLRTFPIRNYSGDHMGFSLDIKAAHKRVCIREEEHGLLGFTLQNQLYFYRVAPFGATFSASWWSRLGGWMLRFFHFLLWWAHVALLYVDDYLFHQSSFGMPISATMICLFCQIVNIPVSWQKCELAFSIQWIGWKIHFRSGFIEIPMQKIDKFLGYLHSMGRSSRTSKRNLEKLIGLALWLTQLWPYMRIWIRHWYHDLYSIPATHYSIDNGDWRQFSSHLDENLHIISRPQGTALPIGGQLLAVRHHTVKTKSDLTTVPLSNKRIWLRIRDPSSTKRHLSSSSLRIIQHFIQWVTGLSPMKPLTPKKYWDGEAAADACASGSTCEIGGFVKSATGQIYWFSEIYSHSDFTQLGIELDAEMQRSISAFETLAQIALLFVTSKFFPAHRMPICLKSLSDNSGAESGSNKLWSMTYPLSIFLERMCLLSAMLGMEIDVNHIPGSQNILADDLSRWDQTGSPPHSFHLKDRIRIPLAELWQIRTSPTLIPKEASIPWTLPTV